MKFRRALFIIYTIIGIQRVPAQNPVNDAPPLEVKSSPLVSVQQVGQDASLATSLRTIPGVVVVPQGVPSGQSDLSIRGSAFSGAGLSLGGLSLRNAQTEHFHAELPFPATWFARPTVLTGVGQAAKTEGHLTGTVHLTPLPVQSRTRTTAGMDNKDGVWANGNAERVRETKEGQFGVGVFAGHTYIPGVDLPDNDIESNRIAARSQIIRPSGQGDLWFGHQEKAFGTRGYYGVTPLLDSEEETKDTLLYGGWTSSSADEPWSASILLRHFEDDYRLQLPSSLFQNEHETRSAALQASRTIRLSDSIHLVSRIAAETEEIDSSALGDFERSRLSGTLLPRFRVADGVFLFVGARGELLEEEENVLLPLARIEVNTSETLALFAEYSESVRLPSYTELNYESPGSLGNSGLGLQRQNAWETGIGWDLNESTTVDAALFHHRTEDTVDWIRSGPEATRWQAENIGTVNTLGAEAVLSRSMSDQYTAIVSYMWLDKDTREEPFASRYALDYARHLARIQLDWTPTNWLRVEIAQIYREQADHVLRTKGGNTQWWTRAALHIRCPDLENIQFSLMALNATEDPYRPFPGQDTVTQRRVSAAVTVDW